MADPRRARLLDPSASSLFPSVQFFSVSPDNQLASILVRADTVFLKSTHSPCDLFYRFEQSLTEKYGKPSYSDDNRSKRRLAPAVDVYQTPMDHTWEVMRSNQTWPSDFVVNYPASLAI